MGPRLVGFELAMVTYVVKMFSFQTRLYGNIFYQYEYTGNRIYDELRQITKTKIPYLIIVLWVNFLLVVDSYIKRNNGRTKISTIKR